MRLPLVVVVTGSECTGKTTLAASLAGRYATAWSPEYVRAFVAEAGRAPRASDVEAIARGQIAGEDAAEKEASRLVVRDTDLVSTLVYARHYFGSCPAWIEQAARVRRGDLYLLCHPDVPWTADGLQRDRPESREQIHGVFGDTLASLGARVVAVRGSWDARHARAYAAVEELLSEITHLAGATTSDYS
jgi:NadR type nicotinamide-nucleotide adenylyltransferase